MFVKIRDFKGCLVSVAISAAYLLTRRRGVTGVFLSSVGVTCVTVVKKRR